MIEFLPVTGWAQKNPRIHGFTTELFYLISVNFYDTKAKGRRGRARPLVVQGGLEPWGQSRTSPLMVHKYKMYVVIFIP